MTSEIYFFGDPNLNGDLCITYQDNNKNSLENNY